MKITIKDLIEVLKKCNPESGVSIFGVTEQITHSKGIEVFENKSKTFVCINGIYENVLTYRSK